MRRNKPRYFLAFIYKPRAANIQARSVRSNHYSFNDILRAQGRFIRFDYQMIGNMPTQRSGQLFPLVPFEAERLKERRFALADSVRRRKQIPCDFLLRDRRTAEIRQLHTTIDTRRSDSSNVMQENGGLRAGRASRSRGPAVSGYRQGRKDRSPTAAIEASPAPAEREWEAGGEAGAAIDFTCARR